MMRYIDFIKRMLLRLVFGNRTYSYMCRSLSQDSRLRSARLTDIIVRKDGREVRIEADWLKNLCKIVEKDLTSPVPQPGDYK